jgi:hypothetical protein
MLFVCHYALQNRFDFFHLNPEAFIFFEQALKLQEPNSDIISCEVYLFRREY